MYVVELRMLVPLPGIAVAAKASKVVVLPFVPAAGLVLHDDVLAGNSEGLTVARAGWLPTRGRFVVRVEDSVEPEAIGDAQAVLAHYAERGWSVRGRSPP